MCGIVGFLSTSASQSGDDMADICAKMAATIAYRGPDDKGEWVDPSAGIGLGHRRLSIIDLTSMGHQPMVSASGRSAIVYNGEIYNHAELRSDLERAGVRVAGGSDTAVLLEACEAWGVQRTVERLIGMFAFAFWNSGNQTLSLARDRLGIKPLYWGRFGTTVIFASELKAFCPHPNFRPEVNRAAITSFLRHNYVPAPLSIYAGVEKLRQGAILSFDRSGGPPRETVYWSLADVARSGIAASRRKFSDAEAEENLDVLLRDAVSRRMIADVPLGAFLSGGVDSSTVVSLMQAQSTRPVKTFSIGFPEAEYDEAIHAKAVAAHLGTEHTEFYVDSKHALDVIPSLPAMFDEPFADSSQIPTFLVSQLARKHVTVSLSGDGGDELFGGYNRYIVARSLWRTLDRIPVRIRALAARSGTSLSPARWDALAKCVPAKFRQPFVGDKIHKMSALMTARGADDFYNRLISHWEDAAAIVIGGQPANNGFAPELIPFVGDPVSRMQYLDTLTYLPDDILTKVDRASMSVSLEARVPLIDHRVVEFAWTLPSSFRFRNGQSKWLLRQVLRRYVPDRLINRPKMGFGVPLGAWMRGPLRAWAEELLNESRLRREGYLRPEPIRRRWREHLSGERNWQYSLWGVLMFQAWLENQGQQVSHERLGSA